jgi:hypothetical protein
MKFRVILCNSGGELDSRELDVDPRAEPAFELDHAIHDVIDEWILSPGDLIQITQPAP